MLIWVEHEKSFITLGPGRWKSDCSKECTVKDSLECRRKGSSKLWKSWKIWKITKKSSMHGKIMEFKKSWTWKTHGILWNNMTKPPVAQKLAVRYTKLVCLTAGFLATGGFKFWLFQNACMVYKHAYLNTLLLLLSTFMLVVKKSRCL